MDVRTINIFVFIAWLILVLVLLYQNRTLKKYRGINLWSAGMAIIGLAYGCSALRTLPGFQEFAIISFNTLNIIGLSFLYAGSRSFRSMQPSNRIPVLVCSVQTLAIAFFTVIDYHYIIRSLASTLCSSILIFMIAYVFISWRRPKPSGPANLLAIAFLTTGVLIIARSVGVALSDGASDFYTPALVHYSVFFISLLSGLLWTFGFILLINERLREDGEESLIRFQLVFQDYPDGILITETDTGRIMDANARFEKLSGIPVSELKGKNAGEFNLGNITSGILTDGGAPVTDVMIPSGDGQAVPCRASHQIIHTGGKTQLMITVHDRSDEIMVEKVRQARLDLLEYSSGEVSYLEVLRFTLDLTETLSGSNIGFFHFVEPDQKSLTLQQWSTNTVNHMCSILATGSNYEIAQAGVWAECFFTRKPVIHNDYGSLEHRKGMPEGHARVIRELVVPVERGGKIMAILGVGNKATDYHEADVRNVATLADLAWDIVEKNRANEALMVSAESLRRSNLEKDKLFSIIAHDLRSPFNVFLGFTQLLAEDLSSLTREEIGQMAIRMRRSAGNLYDLLENLLEWSRMQRGVTSFTPERFAAREVIFKATEALRDQADTKGVTITYDLDPVQEVIADRHMLESIFRNLVGNAVKFTRKGGTVTLTSLQTENEETEFYVRDTGIGIGADMVDHVFDFDQPFNRPGTSGEPSTGLGLIVCREFVEKHGGKISVESQEGVGSLFKFTIPSL